MPPPGGTDSPAKCIKRQESRNRHRDLDPKRRGLRPAHVVGNTQPHCDAPPRNRYYDCPKTPPIEFDFPNLNGGRLNRARLNYWRLGMAFRNHAAIIPRKKSRAGDAVQQSPISRRGKRRGAVQGAAIRPSPDMPSGRQAMRPRGCGGGAGDIYLLLSMCGSDRRSVLRDEGRRPGAGRQLLQSLQWPPHIPRVADSSSLAWGRCSWW